MTITALRRWSILGVFAVLVALVGTSLVQSAVRATEAFGIRQDRARMLDAYLVRAAAVRAQQAEEGARAGYRPLSVPSAADAGACVLGAIETVVPAGMSLDANWSEVQSGWIEVRLTGSASEAGIRRLIDALTALLPHVAVVRLHIRTADGSESGRLRFDLVLRQAWSEEGV